jgi:flagellar motor switch protein FliG
MNAPASLASANSDRAAVMVMLLGEEDAARLLGQLSPDELQRLGSRMCALGEIGPEAISDAISSFASCADRPVISAHDRVGEVRRMMTGAVGEIKADSLMRRVAPEEQGDKASAIELVRWLEPEVIIPLIEDEPPQAIAVLLAQLDPIVAAKVLVGLPEALHTSVVHRIAKLGPVSRQAMAILEETLDAKIGRQHGSIAYRMGGVAEAAQIINNAARSVEKRVVPGIGKIDKKLAQQLENEMFKFEHLYTLDNMMMGQLLREVESALLIDALKGIPQEDRENFFSAMSSRAAEGLRDEIEERGRIKRSDVEVAQREIVAIAKRLAAEGTIVLGGGEEDYV